MGPQCGRYVGMNRLADFAIMVRVDVGSMGPVREEFEMSGWHVVGGRGTGSMGP